MPTLIVEVVAARNLTVKGSSIPTPQVKIIVRRPGSSKDAKKCKTKSKKKTADPVFKEVFTFTEVNQGDELILEIWNSTKNSFLGQVFVKLDSSISDRAGKFAEWLALRDRGKSADGEIQGEVYIELLMSRELAVMTRSDGSLVDSPRADSPQSKKKFNSLRIKSGPLKKETLKRQNSLQSVKEMEKSAASAKFGASSASVSLKPTATPVLGIPLSELMQRQEKKHPNLQIPSFCQRALNELNKRNAFATEGIFRLEANNEELDKALSQGDQVRFSKIESVHTVAGVLKIFFRELPEPVMSYFFWAQFIESVDASQPLPAPRLIKRAIEKLPETNYHLLRRIIKFAYKVTQCFDHSKMNSTNLSIVLGPNLLWRENKSAACLSGEQDLSQYRTSLAVATKVVSYIIDEYPNIFPSPAQALESLVTTDGDWVKGADGSMYCVTEEQVVVEYDENGAPQSPLIVEVIEVEEEDEEEEEDD